MAEIKVLQTDKEALVKDAAGVLKEALEADFETVIVVGLKDKEVHFRKSKNVDTLRLLGAIDAAKQHIFENWD